VEKFLTESLTALQVEYVDLYLIHLPVGFQDNGDGNLWPTDETGAMLVDPSTDHISLWKVSKYMKHMFLFFCSGSLYQVLMPLYFAVLLHFCVQCG
jgi:diketogulonate reductase-like aldo/keto reductase